MWLCVEVGLDLGKRGWALRMDSSSVCVSVGGGKFPGDNKELGSFVLLGKVEKKKKLLHSEVLFH